jgi:hypothetical protein
VNGVCACAIDSGDSRMAEIAAAKQNLRKSVFFRNSCINQRQGHILKGRCSWKQIEGLKDKADFLIPDISQLIIAHLTNIQLI